jgi:hypothetical protein
MDFNIGEKMKKYILVIAAFLATSAYATTDSYVICYDDISSGSDNMVIIKNSTEAEIFWGTHCSYKLNGTNATRYNREMEEQSPSAYMFFEPNKFQFLYLTDLELKSEVYYRGKSSLATCHKASMQLVLKTRVWHTMQCHP